MTFLKLHTSVFRIATVVLGSYHYVTWRKLLKDSSMFFVYYEKLSQHLYKFRASTCIIYVLSERFVIYMMKKIK